MEDITKSDILTSTTDSLSETDTSHDINGSDVTEVLAEVPAHDGAETYQEDLEAVPDQEPHPEDSEITGEANTEEKNERITQFPMSRIKQIMKMDPEVTLASQDAVFVICKSTEFFVRTLVKEAHQYTAQLNRKTVQKKDVDSAISNTDCLLFLDGAIDSLMA